jgi:acyl-CoA thioesterase FadM
MARRHRITIPIDTCLFSPTQLQPATVLRYGMMGLAATIRTQLVEWPILKKEHRRTVVIAGVTIDYLRPFMFFSAPEIEVDSGLIARRSGKFLELDCRLRTPDGDFARLAMLTRPVQLSGSDALDATPADLDEPLLGRFAADERDDRPVVRALPGRIEEVVGQGTLVGEGATSFFISRSDCEIADQWQNVRLPDWFASGREQLVLRQPDPILTVGLRQPMARFVAEFRRPMYFGDQGALRTRAYRHGAALVFVHEFFSMLPSIDEARRPLCAAGIEEFSIGNEER